MTSAETGRATHSIRAEVTIAAPREAVWERLADHEGMPAWMPVREVVRRRPGSPDPNGVGAVRTVRLRGMVVEEEVTGFEPPERLRYRLTEGAPIRDHRGEVTLHASGDRCRVEWRIEFRPLIPGTGWLVARVLRREIARGLEGLRVLIESRRAAPG
jgi:uncharacterized protein YndB with AHSA1/START domain